MGASGHPLNDPVYGFADAIGMEAARGLIADGLNEAIRRGVELGATPPEQSLLVTWDGQRVAIENTALARGRTHAWTTEQTIPEKFTVEMPHLGARL